MYLMHLLIKRVKSLMQLKRYISGLYNIKDPKNRVGKEVIKAEHFPFSLIFAI